MRISRHTSRRILPFLLLALANPAPLTHAKVTLAPLFQDRAVLQRDTPLPVWGTADPGEKVTLTYTSPTLVRTATATATDDGRWQTTLAPLPAESASATLTAEGTNKLARTDILVGDVWLASGQSNMEWALGWGTRVLNARDEIAAANSPHIRQFKIKNVVADAPRDTLPGEWRPGIPRSMVNYSAVAWFFARELHQKLGIPIGIINSTWGGSQIESWIPAAALASDPSAPAVRKRWDDMLAAYPEKMTRYEEAKAGWDAAKAAASAAGQPFTKQPPFKPNGPGSLHTPSGLYNAMIHPLVPGALRGIIWYQGESNSGRPGEYRTLFPTLIRGWRAAFAQGDLPFYWVQLANYAGNGAQKTDWAELREAQSSALVLPATGQAIAIDIGESGNVHPANKQEAGRRLALLALARAYGQTDVIDSGPTFVRADFQPDDSVRIHFSNTHGGLVSATAPAPGAASGAGAAAAAGAATIGGFELARADRVFCPADETRIDGDAVIVRSTKITRPEAVRYAWRNDPKPSPALANGAGLPAAPFRTDSWQ
ncbi:MAG: sialate O-acetylesterase [Opitutaceae bacterium]|jgi:sialate O-acetylesterase|nr:sialate O-acetylesterase [Opitutaceae bacterium]